MERSAGPIGTSTNIRSRFACDSCGKEFSLKAEVESHFHSCQYTFYMGERYSCDKCFNSFVSKKRLLYHAKMTLCREQPTMICDLCGATNRSNGNFGIHFMKHHSDIPREKYSCENCQQSFYEKTRLMRHAEACSNLPVVCISDKFVCEICGESSKAHRYTLKHISAKHPEIEQSKKCGSAKINPVKCDRCNEDFSGKHNFVAHLNRCGYRAKRKLEQTAAKDAKEMVNCDLCSAVTRKSDIREHIFELHSDVLGLGKSEPEKLICDVCKKECWGRLGFKLHQSNCASSRGRSKSFRCDKCARAFVTRSRIINHVHQHCGDRTPFRCDLCGTSLWTRNCLLKHIEVHHPYSEREFYGCGSCKRMFRKKSNLVNHVLGCTGSRRFICNLCRTAETDRRKFSLHLDKFHPLTIGVPLRCFDCATGNELISQTNNTSALDPRKCQLCGKPRLTKKQVRSRLAEMRRPRKCRSCEFTTDTAGKMKTHRKNYHHSRLMSAKNVR